MPYDSNGELYIKVMSNHSLQSPQMTQRLMKALHFLVLAITEDTGITNESTVSVAYAKKNLYVAKLHAVRPPVTYVEKIEAIISAPLDGEAEEILSVFEDGDECPVENVIGVGGGESGLHAEMMIVKYLGGMTAWEPETLTYRVGMAASQGACPACAGFMNLKGIWHTGVRSNGRVSSQWINPVDNTICGSTVVFGVIFNNKVVEAGNQWKKDH